VTLGSDVFWTGTDQDGPHVEMLKRFLEQLPEYLAHRIGWENPARIHGLP